MVRFVDQPDAGATFSEKETVVTLESVKAVGEVSRLSSQLSFSPRSSHGSSASVSSQFETLSLVRRFSAN